MEEQLVVLFDALRVVSQKHVHRIDQTASRDPEAALVAAAKVSEPNDDLKLQVHRRLCSSLVRVRIEHPLKQIREASAVRAEDVVPLRARRQVILREVR